MPVIISDIPFFAHRRTATTTTPIPTLTLLSAEYVEADHVDLTFDRAIDIAGIEVGAFTVDDQIGFRYVGDSAELLLPATVRVMLVGLIEEPYVGVHMTVLAINGIIASDDGAAWGGVTDLELPFP